ncbi:MAG: LysM peptidoglycan-binding domain-containing protein [Victivallales bacterium]
MKNKRMKVLLGVTAVLAIGTLGLSGCKSQEVLKDRPYIPSPTDNPTVAPVSVTPLLTPPALPEIKTEPIKYSVKSGDSFWKIARQYGVSKEELAAYNNMSLQKPLKVGVSLMIPPGGAPVSPEKLSSHGKAAPAGKEGAKHPSDGSYTVGNGDSIWKIAAKYNIKGDALVAANNLDPKKPLQVGQKLVIPEAGATAAPAAAKTAHAAPAGKAAPAAGKTTEPAAVPAAEPAKAAGPSEEEKLLNELEGGAPATGATGMTSGTTAGPVAEAVAFDTYEVQEGDTVEDVAAMHGVRADDVKKANPGLPADGKLKPPMSLKIPSAK